MKTKHLFYTLALSAAFAACSQEEIVSQQEVAKVDLGNRPVVGNVTLNFGEAESRGTVADRAFNAIDFVEGEDGFGARVIDIYQGFTPTAGHTLDHASRKYEVKDEFASSNYKYVNNGGASWITDALMVEGNYMFYYPYNEANLSRTPNQVVLPLAQTVKPNEEDGYRNPIKDLYEGTNPAIVGYTFLSATDQDATVSPKLQHLFAYPQITLTNNYTVTEKIGGEDEEVGKEITITKIILTSTEFHEKGLIKHTGLVSALRDFSVAAVANTNLTAIPAGTWNAKTKTGEYSAKTADVVAWGDAEENEGKITVTFDGGLTLAPEASYSFHIVAPAANYASIAMDVYLSNDKMFSTTFSLSNLTFAAGKRYPTEAYNFPTNGNPAVKDDPSSLAAVKLTGSLTDAKDPAELIDNIEEFEAFLRTIPNNTTAIKEISELGSEMKDEEFVLARDKETGIAKMKIDAAVVELVKKYLNSGTVEFFSNMQVEDTEDAVSLNKMTFNGHLDILAGDVTAAGVTMVDGKNVTVKGGTLTIPANSTSELKNVIVEAGELIVNKTTFGNATASIELDEDGEPTGVVGKITLKKDCGASIDGSLFTLAGGVIEIAEEAGLRIGGSVKTLTEGTITNNGTLIINSNYTIAEDITLNQNGTVDIKSAKVLTNKGTINNYKNLTVTNIETGKVNMMDKKANLTVNGVGGNIDNTVLAYVKVNGERDDQTVWYVWEEDVDVETADAINYCDNAINALIIKGKEFTLDKADDYTYTTKGLSWISAVKFTDGASLYVENTQTVGMTKFFIEGAVEFSGRGMNNASSINLMRAATVKMEKASKLTVNGITVNGGNAPQTLDFTADAPAAGSTATTTAEIVNKGAIKANSVNTYIKKSGTGTWN